MSPRHPSVLPVTAPAPAPAPPYSLTVVTAIVCGVLAAMAAQILLAGYGLDVTGVWPDLTGRGPTVRAATAFWAIMAVALVVGAVIPAAVNHSGLAWQRLRPLRQAVVAALVFALAVVGHMADVKAGGAAGVLAIVAVLTTAGIVALLGAYFAARR